MKEFYNLLLFAVICFLIYILFRTFNYNTTKEGMTDSSGNMISTSQPINGIAGNAASYSASIQAASIKLQDTFLIDKYRTDYENAIINLDDYISNLMLQSTLSIDQTNPMPTIDKLSQMQLAKNALNSVMKYIDEQ